MKTGTSQFMWWRRREEEAANRPTGRFLSRERVKSLGIAVLLAAVGWIGFYWTLGSHRIVGIDEFVRYLKGEDLYRKYEVARVTWDCAGLREQFDMTYLVKAKGRMARENSTLVFVRGGLDRNGFETWVRGANRKLAFGKVRRVDNEGVLIQAMIVRLFTRFRFESGELVRIVQNDFSNKCRS